VGHISDGRYRRGFTRGVADRVPRETAALLSAGKRAATAVMASLGGISTNGQVAMGATDVSDSVEYVFTNGGVMNEILACVSYIFVPLALSTVLAYRIITRKKHWFRQNLSSSEVNALSFICGMQIYAIISPFCITFIEEKLNLSMLIENINVVVLIIFGIYLPYWVICGPCHLPYLIRVLRGKNQSGSKDVIYITGVLAVILIYSFIFWFDNSGVE
jgi:hypothetical protein